MKFLRVFFAVSVGFGLSACASVFKGTHKSIEVTSNPPGALVRLDGDTRAVTPGVLHPSTRRDHEVTLEMAGYKPCVVKLVRKYSAWEWANVLTGGGPGVAFDGLTGAVYEFHPDRIAVNLRPLPKIARPLEPKPEIAKPTAPKPEEPKAGEPKSEEPKAEPRKAD